MEDEKNIGMNDIESIHPEDQPAEPAETPPDTGEFQPAKEAPAEEVFAEKIPAEAAPAESGQVQETLAAAAVPEETVKGGRRFRFGKAKRVRYPADRESGARRLRLGIAFACVILATSIVTSAVSYQFFRYYGTAGSSSLAASESRNTGSESSGGTSSSTGTISYNEGDTLSIAQINSKVSPSVVFIGITYKTSNFFGQTESASASGSGIILSADGYILTNNHVVATADEITVKLSTGENYTAKLVGADDQTDLAVIKIDVSGLTAAELGDSSKVQVGDLAVAIGNPLGTLEGTLTAGVISALNRSITIDNITMNLIQTDAAVNPGNSGGALANRFGQVIGIVNAKTSAVGIEGLGYAIPINEAKNVADDLIKNGYVGGRIRLGISTKDITKDLADYYSLPVGVYVVDVSSGSIADKAGIKSGDVIIGVDGKDISTGAELQAIRDSHKVGDSIKILLVRNGKEKSVTMVFEEYVPS